LKLHRDPTNQSIMSATLFRTSTATRSALRAGASKRAASVASTSFIRGKATLPDLPYDYGALSPVISGEIMQLHHSKHHAAYVKNLNAALEQYEETLCTSVGLNIVWRQILPDPFLRRLILRFIFCRAVFFYFHPVEHGEHLPTCLPSLPESVSPNAKAIKTPILLLAENLVVSNRFHFGNRTM